MKRKRQILISLLISSQLLGVASPIFNGTTIIHAEEINYAEGIPQEGMSDEDTILYEELIYGGLYSLEFNNELIKLLEEAESVENYGDIRLVVEKFTKLHTKVSKESIYREADLYLLDDFKALEIHEVIMSAIHEFADDKLMIKYANQLVMGYVEEPPAFDALIEHLIENNEFEKANKELKRIDNMFALYKKKLIESYHIEGLPEIEVTIVSGKLSSPELEKMLGDDIYGDIERPEFIDKTDEFERPNVPIEETDKKENKPDYKPKDNKHKADTPLPDRTGTYYEYDANKGVRYIVTYHIKTVNGKEVRTETRRIDATGLTSLWSDRIYNFAGDSNITNIDEYEEPEKEEEEKRLTLQYSLNKNDLFPSYIDTGIYTDSDGNADYKAIYDVFYQIAANVVDGYLVEDSNKLLIVVEGKPLYVTEQQSSYSKEEIDKIFDDFENVDLLVEETRIGTTDTLEWQLRSGKSQKLVIDGDEIKLITQPEIRTNRVVLPIVETLEAIGAEVAEEDGIILANYGGIKVKFENGVSEARVDDKLIDLKVAVEPSDRGFYTANITPVLKELGIIAEWDEQESSLVLSNTKRDTLNNDNDDTNDKDELSEDEE